MDPLLGFEPLVKFANINFSLKILWLWVSLEHDKR